MFSKWRVALGSRLSYWLRAFVVVCSATLAMASVDVAPAWAAKTITIYSTGTVAVGQSRKLTAYAEISPNTVNWFVNDIPGGNAEVGTISSAGEYKAPLKVPMPNSVSVKAISTAFPEVMGTGTMTISQAPAQLWSVSPKSVKPGAYSLSVNGANFTPESVVYAGDQPIKTTFKSATGLTANGTAAAEMAGKSIGIHVRNPGTGGTQSPSVALSITAGDGTTPPPDGGTPSIRVSLSPSSATLALSATQQFTASVTGTANTGVSYTVNGIVGGNETLGTISTAGLYRSPAAVPTAAINVGAVSAANSASAASAVVTLVGPPDPGAGQGTANLAVGRFLEQATFGPTPTEITRVKQMGIDAWLDEQFAMPETTIAMPETGSLQNAQLRSQYLNRLTTAPDQLRQRVAYALGNILVISMNKNNYPDQVVPHLRNLSRHAFTNYRDLLDTVTTSAQMGKYLDLANSNKPVPGSNANENYARELMQLFTIGLVALNPDGTPQKDANGQTIPTYDQAAVQQVALALTGWTFQGAGNNNWENFSGPLKPVQANHDTRAKSFLGCNLPAGQIVTQDKDGVLDCLFNHANMGPFVALRLIRAMVISNPSPAYVQRVSQVFANNGGGVRGDLKAVVRAILTDAEARNDTAGVESGRLKDAIQHIAALSRALNGSMTPANNLSWPLSQMAQMPLTPPSVFGFYTPLYRVPKSALAGPEFQIYTPTESVLRANLLWQMVSSPGGDFTVDLAPFTAVAGDTTRLIDVVDQALLYGRMPQAMRQSLANAITAQPDAAARVRTALHLAALSGSYAVQH